MDNNKEFNFNVHFDYKNQLKHYQKTHFDPFSRGDRVPFFMNDTCIITTIGQLNFFKWFISKNVFDFSLFVFCHPVLHGSGLGAWLIRSPAPN